MERGSQTGSDDHTAVGKHVKAHKNTRKPAVLRHMRAYDFCTDTAVYRQHAKIKRLEEEEQR